MTRAISPPFVGDVVWLGELAGLDRWSVPEAESRDMAEFFGGVTTEAVATEFAEDMGRIGRREVERLKALNARGAISGADLAELREAVGITQADMAIRLRISRVAVKNGEARERCTRAWAGRYLRALISPRAAVRVREARWLALSIAPLSEWPAEYR